MQHGIYSYPATKRVIYGTDFILALRRELELCTERRVYVLASGTLERSTDTIERLREALGRPEVPAAELVAELISELGLPRTLREVGVGAELLDRIAEESMHDRWIHTNPRKIEEPAMVRRLLDAAW